jgi:hypothetical protein
LLIFLLKTARPEKYRGRRLSSFERRSPPSPTGEGPPVWGPIPNDPTIHRLTADILAVLEAEKDAP